VLSVRQLQHAEEPRDTDRLAANGGNPDGERFAVGAEGTE
jgi:hypothetical protein